MSKKQATLILLRHGQSEWNKSNLFTGWVDIPLSFEGIQEALKAGHQIAHIPIDVIFTSTLVRGQMTALIAMSVHKGGRVPVMSPKLQGKPMHWAKIYNPKAEKSLIPVIEAWQLNERMYGALQGLNKQETKDRHGEDQVQIWRRSYDVAPPDGESLSDTANRSIPYFKEKVVPHLERGENVFISAHGNSLRSIVMWLDNLTKDQVVKLELPTGLPLLYEYSSGSFTKKTL